MNDPITDKQLKYIESLARRDQDLYEEVIDEIGKDPADMDKREASGVIARLTGQAGPGGPVKVYQRGSTAPKITAEPAALKAGTPPSPGWWLAREIGSGEINIVSVVKGLDEPVVVTSTGTVAWGDLYDAWSPIRWADKESADEFAKTFVTAETL